MTQRNGQSHTRFTLPPNLLAFIAGLILAFFVGLVFRKIIDKTQTKQPQASLHAQSTVEISESPASAPGEPKPNSAAQSPKKPKSSAGNDRSDSPPENKEQTLDEVPGQTQQTATLAPAVDKSSQSATGEVDYLAWRQMFRSVEEMLTKQGMPISSSTLTPRYKHWAKGLAITRGQFMDVVSRKVPANLPTRRSNLGLVLHALSPADFDTVQFQKITEDSGTTLDSLCQENRTIQQTDAIERITIVISNTEPYFKCLQSWLARNPDLKYVLELSLIGFTRGPTFFGSLTSNKKLISLQMWNPDWLVDNTVAMDETGRETPTQKRTLRLGNVARALGQPSDVRMQIPASTRSLVGPLIEPKDSTPPKPLVVGNFALVPSHMPRGTLIATAYTNPGKDRSKSASVLPPGPGRARALVLATQGKNLQFMTINREK